MALRNEHKLHDLISFCVNAVVLPAAQILQESWRLLFEFTARFASLLEMSDKQDDFATDLCSIVPARFASLLEMSDKQDDFTADLCSIVPAD